jgi:3-dehydroquinate synthase
MQTSHTTSPQKSANLHHLTDIYHRLDIDLQPQYPIYIGAGIYDQAQLIEMHLSKKCTQILIVSNDRVAPLHLSRLENSLKQYFQTKYEKQSEGQNQISKIQIQTLILPDGESYKNFEQLQHIIERLLSLNFDRHAMLIALGGGVIGDIVGFAASIYQRGIDFIQMPSTLLAQVDSSVGGKTAINHLRGKNMIGAFWQPKAVISDVLLLNTLDERIFLSGIAEMIKHGVIYDEKYLDFLEINAQKIQEKDAKILAKAIYWACQIKCEIVARDEKESSIRAYLNLGHTFGHAIEAGAGYGRYLHGEAVAIGMMQALKWSVQYEGLELSVAQRIAQLFKNYQLPTALKETDLSAEDYIDYMKLDKKNHQGLIQLILVKKIGDIFIKGVDEQALKQFLSASL